MKALIEVFYQPGKVFASLPERKHAWLAPLLIDMLLVLAISMLTIHIIGMENIVRQRLEATHMSQEQMQVAMSRANSPIQLYVSYIASFLGTGLALAVIAGALTAFGMMTSRAPSYGAMLAMVALAFFPYWVISGVMTAAFLLTTPDTGSLDINNLLATNAAAFMDKNSMPKGLYSLLSSLDVLSFMELSLLTLGFSKVTRSGIGGALAAVGGLWIFYISTKMAISLLF